MGEFRSNGVSSLGTADRHHRVLCFLIFSYILAFQSAQEKVIEPMSNWVSQKEVRG